MGKNSLHPAKKAAIWQLNSKKDLCFLEKLEGKEEKTRVKVLGKAGLWLGRWQFRRTFGLERTWSGVESPESTWAGRNERSWCRFPSRETVSGAWISTLIGVWNAHSHWRGLKVGDGKHLSSKQSCWRQFNGKPIPDPEQLDLQRRHKVG